MKVLQIIDSLNAGGAERMAVNMANAFADNCISSILCVSRKDGVLQGFISKDVHYYLLNKRHVADVFAFARLLGIINRHRPDIIHAHSSSYFWAILAKLFFPRVIIIWHDHQGLRDQAKRNHRPFLKFLSKKINGIIVVNDLLKQWNSMHTHVPGDKIRFINNFPDPRIHPAEKRNDGSINILCLANLRPEKNHPMLIRAFKKAVSSVPYLDLRLWLAGNTSDPVQVNLVKNIIKELSVDDKVILLGTVQNTGTLISKAHIGVLSSSTEGLPVSLLEYGMAGLPVLVTDVGQCKEVVQGGKLGWLVNSRDEEAFAASLVYIIEHPDEAQSKGNALKERISSVYGAKHFVFEYVSFSAQLYPQNKRSQVVAGN